MKLIDKSALVVEIENIKETQFKEGTPTDVYACMALDMVKDVLDTLEVKEVQEEAESIWHDANQQPTMYRKYLVRYSDDRICGSWERHDDGFIPWKDVVKEHGFTHWCYAEDLIKL